MTATPVLTPAGVGAAAARRVPSPRPLLVAGGAVAAATVLVALRDPHTLGSYGFCPFHAITHLWCPTCGGLRATYDLAHLQLGAAWHDNALWVLAAPLVVLAWVVALVRRARGLPAATLPVWAQVVGLALVLAFGVLRNLPAFASLAP